MANGEFLSLESGKKVLKTAINVSTGVPDANKIIQTGPDGLIDPSFLPASGVKTITAFEALAAGDYINIFDNGGAANVRLADAANQRQAHGYVLAAYSALDLATIYFDGGNSQESGRTIGERQYLGAAGASTETPVVASGSIHQYLGVASAVTEVCFEPDDCILIE